MERSLASASAPAFRDHSGIEGSSLQRPPSLAPADRDRRAQPGRLSPPSDALGDLPRWKVRRRGGQMIYQEGEEALTFYRVEAGCVRLQLYSTDGRRQILGFCFPGDLFGFVPGPRDCTAEASTDVDLTEFSASGLLSPDSLRTGLVMQITQRCLSHYRDFAHHMVRIRNLPAAERISAGLDVFAERLARDGGPIQLPLSQLELSDFLGLSPETTSRELRKLRSAGRLKRDGRRLLLMPRRVNGRESRAPLEFIRSEQ